MHAYTGAHNLGADDADAMDAEMGASPAGGGLGGDDEGAVGNVKVSADEPVRTLTHTLTLTVTAALTYSPTGR